MQPVLLSRAQVLERLGNKSVSWLYAAMAEDKFPRPIRLGSCSVAWVQSEIDAFIEQAIAQNRVTLRAKPRSRKAKSATAPDQEPQAA